MGHTGAALADHFWLLYEYVLFWDHLLNHPKAPWNSEEMALIEREAMPWDLWNGKESMDQDPHNRRKNIRHQLRLMFSVCRNALMYEARGRPWGRWKAESFAVEVGSWEAMEFPIGTLAASRQHDCSERANVANVARRSFGYLGSSQA